MADVKLCRSTSVSKPKRLDVTRWAVVWADGQVDIASTRQKAMDMGDWYSTADIYSRICKVRITEIVPKKQAKKERVK